MDRESKRMLKRYHPDGYENDGTPFWILPSDRITYSYEEWCEYDKIFWSEQEKREKKNSL